MVFEHNEFLSLVRMGYFGDRQWIAALSLLHLRNFVTVIIRIP
jgi:hypothetical protein